MEVQSLTNGVKPSLGQEKDGMAEEKVELKETGGGEEVPLQETETNGEAGKDGKPKPKFLSFFHRDKSSKKEEESKPAAEDGAEVPAKEEKEVKPKKEKKEKQPSAVAVWWSSRQARRAEEAAKAKEAGPIFGLNLDDRDEKGVNDHVKLAFEDVLAEPEGYHSFDCAWRLTFRLFTALRSFLYKLIAVVVAVPCAIFWALIFALLTVINVWACVPAARAATIPATWVAKLWNWIIRSLLDPCFRSCGLVCASVHVHRTAGANPAPPPVPNSDPALLA